MVLTVRCSKYQLLLECVSGSAFSPPNRILKRRSLGEKIENFKRIFYVAIAMGNLKLLKIRNIFRHISRRQKLSEEEDEYVRK